MSVPTKTTFFAFFVRAKGGMDVLSTSSREDWVKRLQTQLGQPNAEVKIFWENEWDAPSLDGIDDAIIRRNFPTIQTAIKKVLRTQGIPATVLDKITGDLIKFSQAQTRLVILIAKYTP